ncbi:hypothetical protein FN846DRAFT_577916 [Sphaerosporella brunnea]|uniref:Uncharacterized protein n=1 Tax=Sphaerosporella brunnea TaxID=1250544 RepID=A0A5J5ED86_9PEZI|nr:hypothetical protein FN846DRAFT_577916 [Sphaerosporella brunnea]
MRQSRKGDKKPPSSTTTMASKSASPGGRSQAFSWTETGKAIQAAETTAKAAETIAKAIQAAEAAARTAETTAKAAKAAAKAAEQAELEVDRHMEYWSGMQQGVGEGMELLQQWRRRKTRRRHEEEEEKEEEEKGEDGGDDSDNSDLLYAPPLRKRTSTLSPMAKRLKLVVSTSASGQVKKKQRRLVLGLPLSMAQKKILEGLLSRATDSKEKKALSADNIAKRIRLLESHPKAFLDHMETQRRRGGSLGVQRIAMAGDGASIDDAVVSQDEFGRTLARRGSMPGGPIISDLQPRQKTWASRIADGEALDHLDSSPRLSFLLMLAAKAAGLGHKVLILSHSGVTIAVAKDFLVKSPSGGVYTVMSLENPLVPLVERRDMMQKFPDSIWLVRACDEIFAGLEELNSFDCIFLMETGMPGYDLVGERGTKALDTWFNQEAVVYSFQTMMVDGDGESEELLTAVGGFRHDPTTTGTASLDDHTLNTPKLLVELRSLLSQAKFQVVVRKGC